MLGNGVDLTNGGFFFNLSWIVGKELVHLYLLSKI